MRNIIEGMLKEIQRHKRKKEDLLPFYIQERINKQIRSYYKQILDSYEVLANQKDEAKVAKKLVNNFKNC